MRCQDMLVNLLVLLFATSGYAQAQFILLNPVNSPFNPTFAYGVSSDGSFIAGSHHGSPNGGAYRWSTAGAPTFLGLLNSPGSAVSNAVSNGGSVVVGESFGSATGYEAFRWTQETGMQGLGFLPGHDRSFAFDVSADGNTIVGQSGISGQSRAFLHTASSGMQDLGTLPGYAHSVGRAVSNDGTIVAGHAITASLSHRTFRWTSQGGMVDLGFGGYVEDMSADGSVIVGGTEAGPFRWSASSGLMQLPLFGGEATGVTDDGLRIVGNGQFESSGIDLPFMWDSIGGMRTLKSYLENEAGLNLNGFTLSSTTGISADGKVIVGYGDMPGGLRRGFVAIVPSPSVLIALCVPLLIPRKARRL